MYFKKRTFPKFTLLVLFPSLCSTTTNKGVKGTKRPEKSPMETCHSHVVPTLIGAEDNSGLWLWHGGCSLAQCLQGVLQS